MFRSNCWTTKLISEYMKIKGEAFAQRVLGPVILRLAVSLSTTEVLYRSFSRYTPSRRYSSITYDQVNPARIGSEDLAKNQKAVYEMLEDLVKGLFNSFPFFPSVLKDVFAVTSELVKKYFPEHPNLP